MKAATIPMNISGGNLIASVLNPSFKGVPDATTLAKYLLNALIVIKRNDLPIRIYLSQEVSARISNILKAMGVKFRTIPVDKMSPPYIFLDTEGNYIVIKTVDSDGKTIMEHKAPFTKFIEALQSFYMKEKEKKNHKRERKEKKEVDEIVISAIDLEKFIEEHKDILEED